MATVTLELADDLLSALGDNSSEAARTMRLAAAFQLCAEGRLSTSKAARLAGLSYREFLDAAVQHKAELFPYTTEEIEKELALDVNRDGLDECRWPVAGQRETRREEIGVGDQESG
jgi:predicted HTH domain antitoxin